MPFDKPVLILGYGRSGTTWLAEVISRATGSNCLCEPLSPNVYDGPEVGLGPRDEAEHRQLLDHLDDVLNGEVHHPWLIRYQLDRPINEADHRLDEGVWRRPIIGFKEIRAGAAVDWFAHHISPRIAFTIRRPHEVIVSGMRRPGFWVWGWPASYHVALERTVFDRRADDTPLEQLRPRARRVDSLPERAAVLWAAFHLAALPRLTELGLPWFAHEDLKGPALEELFSHLDLPFHESVAAPERPSLSSSQTPWVELPVDVRAKVEAIVAPVRALGYDRD